jgi:hypothetical protein
MESLLWVTGLSVPGICAALVIVLIRFVKPLIIERMRLRREVNAVSALIRLYKEEDVEPQVAVEMAREDVFGAQSELSKETVSTSANSHSPTEGSDTSNLKPGIMQLLMHLLHGH